MSRTYKGGRKRRRRRRRRRGGSKSRKARRGGGMLTGVLGQLSRALPTIVLYEALRMQGRRMSRRGRGRGRGRRGGKTRRR